VFRFSEVAIICRGRLVFCSCFFCLCCVVGKCVSVSCMVYEDEDTDRRRKAVGPMERGLDRHLWSRRSTESWRWRDGRRARDRLKNRRRETNGESDGKRPTEGGKLRDRQKDERPTEGRETDSEATESDGGDDRARVEPEGRRNESLTTEEGATRERATRERVTSNTVCYIISCVINGQKGKIES
jgi:hypothetical protein